MKPAEGWQAEGRPGRRYAAMRCFVERFARQPGARDKIFAFLRTSSIPACITGCRVYRLGIADLTINLRAINKYS